MPDEPKKPDPIEDIRAGLGLLFRAAKTAVDEFPTGKIEEAVKEGAREVGRALETVGEVIDEKVLGKKKPSHHPPAGPPAQNAPPTAQSQAQGAQSQAQGGQATDADKPKDPAAPDSSRPTPVGSDPK